MGKVARSTILQLDLSARAGGGANTQKREALVQTSAILTQARVARRTQCGRAIVDPKGVRPGPPALLGCT